MERRCYFNEEHVAFTARALLTGAAGLRPFIERLQAIHWPTSFKVIGVTTYDGNANPTQWLTHYEITVLVVGGCHGKLLTCSTRSIYEQLAPKPPRKLHSFVG
jgi:hypothetical protein